MQNDYNLGFSVSTKDTLTLNRLEKSGIKPPTLQLMDILLYYCTNTEETRFCS